MSFAYDLSGSLIFELDEEEIAEKNTVRCDLNVYLNVHFCNCTIILKCALSLGRGHLFIVMFRFKCVLIPLSVLLLILMI